MSDTAPKPEFFKDIYKNKMGAPQKIPWDIEGHQTALNKVSNIFQGSVLDAGCGLGNNSSWVSSMPNVTNVLGLDLSEEAIAEANRRHSANPKLKFKVADLFHLEDHHNKFDTLLDSAVFHCIGDDKQQQNYVTSVSRCIKKGGKVVMLVFSDENPDPWVGPRRISPDHARSVWTRENWDVLSIEKAEYIDNMRPSPGKAILMVAIKK